MMACEFAVEGGIDICVNVYPQKNHALFAWTEQNYRRERS